MKSIYYIHVGSAQVAIADVMKYQDGFMINRINVPKAFRGNGVARDLLAQILKDADEQQVVLYLTVSPSDGLNFLQLSQWYERAGFAHIYDGKKGYMTRSCQPIK